ncbi:conserved hypothetical protein [Gammaproteobacteria bacterium]
MEGISDIKIIGVDEKKPPRLRKEPYIDIVFKLSHQAPPDWCDDFNNLMTKLKTTGKINKTEGLYIETWVRAMEEIPKLLEQLQKGVGECSRNYIAKILQQQQSATDNADSLREVGGEQGRLNRIMAGLKFDEEENIPSSLSKSKFLR